MRCFVAVLLFTALSFAQEFRGTFSGVVTDATGGQVPNAKVTVTEIHTGVKIQTVTDSNGQYTAPFLLAGDYDISVQAQGFKEYIRKAVHLGAGDHTVIDIPLEVGNSAQTVQVSADAPLLNTENASVGQAVTTKEVDELPNNGRTPMTLSALALGVIATGQPGLIHPFDSGGAAGWSPGGTYAQTSELLVDGAPNATWDGRLAYSAPQDSVQEVRVKVFDMDAAYGHTGAGTFNQVMKTGTNSFHGSLYEFNQASNLTANTFFNNKNSLGNPLTHFNQYGLTAGGPIFIPKVIDTRNKLFWFFAWEGLKDSQPNSDTTSVPTDAERQGNFGQILSADKTILYDPSTAVLNGTTITRSPFPNNVIPTTQLNPIALAYMKYYPEPNITTGPADGALNFGNTSTTNDNYNNELGRLDYNMTEKSRLAFNVRRTGYDQVKNNYFNNISQGSTLFRNNWGASLDEVYTLNATNVINVRLNFTRMAEIHGAPSDGFNPTTLGFPSYIAANSHYLTMPYISFSGSCGSQTSFQCLGGTGQTNLPSQSLQFFGDWVKIKGSHTLKFGADVRQYRLSTYTAGNSSSGFTFTSNPWVKASSTASSTVAWGQDLAEFMLGLPGTTTTSGGSFDLNTFGSFYSYYTAGFAQDDWRVRRNLTVTLGVRYDHDGPYNEKYGRTVNGFAFNTPNPLQAAAQAAYAQNPIAQLPANQFQVLGGLTYPNGGTSVFQNTSHLVSPRAGFAWSPEMFHGKTVIRGGFGLFVAPIAISNFALSGTYGSTPFLNQQGFSQTTTMIASNNNYLSPAATLSNPFPSGFLTPSGSSLGLLIFAGQAVSFLNPNMENPYSMRWNFGIQQTLATNMMLEVVYVGNHAVHLPVAATQLNGIPRQFLSTLGTRDPSVAYLSASTPNPFAGLGTSLNGSTVSAAQVLAKYPEFPVGDAVGGYSGTGGVLENNLNVGSSFYDSLNVRLLKRYSTGLSVIGNYIYSKLIEFDSWLNDSDPRPEKRISPTDHPHRFVTAVTYELPFGNGRRFDLHSKLGNNIFGGWSMNSIYTFQVGAPVTWLNGSTSTPGDYIYFGGSVDLNNRYTNGVALNTSVFDTNSNHSLQYHIRTFPTAFATIRQDGINQWDASILKKISITERIALQLRLEGFNILNHPTFSAPNTTATSSQFGLITAQANRPRTMQIGARIIF